MSFAALLLAIALPSSTQATTAPATAPATAPISEVVSSTTQSSTIDVSPQILALIDQLNADEGKARQGAQDQLVAMGSEAVSALRAAIASSDEEEVRQRAAAALAQILENLTVGPSLITIHAHNLATRDLFAELSKQAGAPLDPVQPEMWDSRSWPTVSIDLDGEPFWKALREISDQTGIELRQWNDGVGLMAMQGRQQVGRPFISGPFLVSLLSETRSQNIVLGESDATTSSNFSLQFNAVAEPKLKVLRYAGLARLEEATDDAGNSLLAADVDHQSMRRRGLNDEAANIAGGATWSFTAQLAYPIQSGRRLASLRGSVGVVLQTAAEKIEVRDILSASNAVRDIGGLRLTVVSLKKLENRFELNITIARDPTNKTTSHGLLRGEQIAWDRVQQTYGDLKLLDDQDRPLRQIGMSSNGNDQSYQLTFTFNMENAQRGPIGRRPKPSEPAKLIWSVPTEIREERVPFEFHDLPLPN